MTLMQKKNLPLAFFLLLAGLLLFSCAQKTDSESFLSQLDGVDAYIRQGQTADAMALLRRAEKKAFSSFARLGIFRRYLTLGETEHAEKVLQHALKTLDDNPEIHAVYGHFLLRAGRTDEALALLRPLAGTKYGSLYAETVLKKVTEAEELDSFLAADLAAVYYDAYAGTKNSRWLMNAALVHLLQGNYRDAAQLQDDRRMTAQESLFWAYVQYDAEHYDRCLDNLAQVRSEILLPAAAELASDAYVMLDDTDSAERSRNVLLQYKSTIPTEIPPSLKVNSALWAQARGEYQKAYDLLFDAVTNHADYAPALVTYGRFAYEASIPPEMTELEKSLRRTDFRTKAMQAYDDRPKVLISDALYRMQTRLDEQKKAGADSDEDLLVAYVQLYLKAHPEMHETARIAYLWKSLEENERGTSLYPPKLVQLCVHELLRAGQTENARNLFTNYLDARYRLKNTSTEPERTTRTDVFGGERVEVAQEIPADVLRLTFGDRAAQGVYEMDIWECETAAYFALLDNNSDAARRLYEYALFETGGVHRQSASAPIVSISPLASSVSATNLAMMYSSMGDRKNALALYGLVAGRTRESITKAALLYRSAEIQAASGDTNGALLSLDYCLSLNASHVDARLLRRKLSE